MIAETKEQTIFTHTGKNIETDRDIKIIAKFEEPLVVILDNMLSDEECDELILLSSDTMQRSKVGMAHAENEIRTSSGAFIEEENNLTIMRIEKRIEAVMGIPIAHGERLHVLRYEPGQEYKAHHDYFSSCVTNNRISTLVMYLNDVEQGGETYFPHLKLTVTPKKGMAVYFEYFYDDPLLNDLTLHGGAPIEAGEKWVATQWMRKQRVR